MPRFRNDTGGVLMSVDFGLIGPNEFAPDEYDPEVHGVLTGCTRVDDPPEVDTGGEVGTTAPADDQPARKRRSAAGKDKEAGE